MTHDELLTIISVSESFLKEKEQFLLAKHISALRAIVELHKPYREESYWAEGLGSRPQDFCSVCIRASKNAWSTYPDTALPVYYPCPTIQAIEKELG
jgi:hypothetical protein